MKYANYFVEFQEALKRLLAAQKSYIEDSEQDYPLSYRLEQRDEVHFNEVNVLRHYNKVLTELQQLERTIKENEDIVEGEVIEVIEIVVVG